MATTLQDRFNINAQNELLATKYVGTGHADISRFEWNAHIKRDTYASIVGHHHLAAYQAIGENESIGRIKFKCKQSMLLPCGVPPEQEDEK
jgi:splicing factor 3B subunit 5